MSHRIECFFDCSSPWTYLAFEYLQTRMAGLDLTPRRDQLPFQAGFRLPDL